MKRSIRHIRIGGVLAALAVLGSGVQAQELSGDVVGISDGDTLTVLVEQRQVRVRLAEIDAPERGQAFGNKARQHLGDLCIRRPAKVTPQVQDVYGRLVARVRCDGVDASEAQVRAGFAWVYTKYAPLDSPLYVLESEARTARRGLWLDPKPQAPWDRRAPLRARRDPALDASTVSPAATTRDERCPEGPGLRRADGSCASTDDLVSDLLLPPKRELVPDKGCGWRGGPGFRRSNGQCASWSDF